MRKEGKLITKTPLILRGERPCRPRNAVRGDKRTGEADRVLPASHKSAEPVEAGCVGTSAPADDPARAFAMERETEPMVEAPSDDDTCRRGSGQDGLRAGGALDRGREARSGGVRATAHQPSDGPAWSEGPNPHGVESAPVANQRSGVEPENLARSSDDPACGIVPMAEATGERTGEGQSLRSSSRAGKPSTWRRQAVDTTSKQEVDLCPTR